MTRSLVLFLAFVVVAGSAVAAGGIFFLAFPGETPSTTRASEPTPIAHVPETIFDFGTMDPFQEGRHTFVIYNKGDKPLSLTQGETSCKCTLSELPENTVPPGGAGRVTLEWKTHKVKDLFANTAEIITDDPQNRVITFRVEGRVLHEVQTAPDGLIFDTLPPGEASEKSLLVFSQTWEDFRLDDVATTVPGVTWTSRPATPEELAAYDAKAGYSLAVTVPATMPSGDFSGSITFEAVPTSGKSAGQHYEALIGGKITRSVCVYGLEFTDNGGLDLGTYVKGERKEWTGIIKLRGERQTIEVLSIETVPTDLQIEIAPYGSPDKPRPGLYSFRIILPENSAPGSYGKHTTIGKIVVRTDHPLDPVLEIPLSITVLARAE